MAFKLIVLLLVAVPNIGLAADVNAMDAIELQKIMQKEEVSALKTELLVEKSEKKAIQQLLKLIKKYKNTPLEADMQMRLAELYVRRSKTVLFFELNRDSSNVIDFMPKRLKNKSSRDLVSKAIKVYSYIERKFPNFENIDLVIFNNAMAYQQIGKPKVARDKYWSLIKKHNYSALVPDAHLAIGEINYSLKKFKKALEHFLAIKKYPQSRVYPYGMYKGAWAYFNLQKAEMGLKELESVVEYGRYVSENKIDARLDLRKEALSDMALFYSDIRPANKAYVYFKGQAGKLDAAPYIFRLAAIYGSHAKYKKKQVVLVDFINNEVKSNKLPEAQDLLVQNYEDMKLRPAAVKQLQVFEEFCYNSRWSKFDEKEDVGGEKKKVVLECQDRLNKTSKRLATKWLRLWKKNPTYPVFARSAEGGYAIYLAHNTRAKGARKVRYIYADLLFQLKKYRMASTQYEMVGDFFLPKKGEKEKYNKMAHDSRYASIVSLEKAVKDKWSENDELLLKKLVKNYTHSHPKGKHRLSVEFKLGVIAYDKKRYDEAQALFKELGDKYSHKKKGIRSQDLYLDILNIKKDYLTLKTYTSQLMAKTKDKKRKVKLRKIYEQSYFVVVQQIEESGALKKAAVEYKKFAKENKTSPLAEKAWWNAIQLHYKTQEFLLGAQAAETYYKLFPGAPHVKEALVKAAQSYEAIGGTKKAANTLFLLSKIDKKSRLKWLNLSADFELLSGNDEKAKKIYYDILNMPNEKYHRMAMKNIEMIEAKKPMSSGHKKIMRIIISKNIQPEASLMQLKILESVYAQKDDAKSFSEAKKVLGMGKKASSYAKARARFIQAEILEREFDRQSLKTNINRLSVVLNLKTGRLEKAQRAYESTIRYGDPKMSVQAMSRMGLMYKKFFNDLKNMPLPQGLGEKDAPAFRQEIEKIAYPMEEKSIETLAESYKLATKFELHDGSVPELKKKMLEANMAKTLPTMVQVTAPKVILAIEKGGL